MINLTLGETSHHLGGSLCGFICILCAISFGLSSHLHENMEWRKILDSPRLFADWQNPAHKKNAPFKQ